MVNIFGSTWDKMSVPIEATVGAIDDEGSLIRVGMSSMQFANLGLSGIWENSTVTVTVRDRKMRSIPSGAFGPRFIGGDKIRVTTVLAKKLGIHVGQKVLLEPHQP